MRVLIRIVGYAGKYRVRLSMAYVAVLAFTGFSLSIPWLLGEAIDTALSSGQLIQLILFGLAIIAVSVGRGIAAFARSYLSESVSEKVAYDLRNEFYDHHQRLSLSYQDEQQTGDLMSRATSDVEGVRTFVYSGLVNTAYNATLLIGVSVLVINLNWRLALICLAFAPLIAWRTGLIYGTARGVWAFVQKEIGSLTTELQENLSGQRVVKAFNAEEYEKEKFHVKARSVLTGSYQVHILSASVGSMMTAFQMGAIGIVLWIGGRDVIAGSMTPGEMAQFILYLNLLVQPIRMIGQLLLLFSRSISSGKRLFAVLDAKSPVKQQSKAVTISKLKGHIVFENVSFKYNNEGPPVLNNISFEALPGQSIALVGKPGSGKTTIINLIPRFYDVFSGRITIDGHALQELSLSSLRNNIGIVQQDVFLFTDTIRENITYGRINASARDITEAAQRAQIHDFIINQPEGYDTPVGERGSTLSGGQRQRIGIARALVLNPAILILDDSTSSVDVSTEHLIQQSLQEVIKGRTTFIIAHRLSTVKNANLILVIDNGEIVQRGTHEQLLCQTGIYHQIYDLQVHTDQKYSNLSDSVHTKGSSGSEYIPKLIHNRSDQ